MSPNLKNMYFHLIASKKSCPRLRDFLKYNSPLPEVGVVLDQVAAEHVGLPDERQAEPRPRREAPRPPDGEVLSEDDGGDGGERQEE